MGHTKVLVIGLDGATLDVVKPAVEQGVMPNVARLMKQGVHGVLHSTIPAMSPPAWTSMISGQNPGKHGIYDFVRRQPGSYRLQTVRSDFYQYQTMFDYLSSLGKRVAAINIPLTYPPRPINGIMIAGLGAPRNGQFTYPPQLRDELLADGYQLDNEIEFHPGHEREFADALIDTARRQVEWSIKLLRSGYWDLFMFVLRSLDEAQSFLWHYHDPLHPWYDTQKVAREGDLLLDVHQRTDALLGPVLDAIGEDTTVFIVSDHGGGSLLKEVFLNNWLQQQGWLKLKQRHFVQRIGQNLLRRIGFTRENLSQHFAGAKMTRLRQRIPLSVQHSLAPSQSITLDEAVDWTRTKAYSFGYVGQIYVNLEGREPQGIVKPGTEYNELIEEISRRLFELTDPAIGEKVVDAVFRADKIYDGPYAHVAPDLTVIMRNMSYLSHSRREFASREIFATPKTDESGTHRPDGMFVITGKDFRNDKGPLRSEIIDIMPTILMALQSNIPTYVDGTPIHNAIKSQSLLDLVDVRVDADENTPKYNINVWSNPTEEQEVIDRLRALGYLE